MRYLRGIVSFWLIVSAPLLGMAPLAEGAFLCWGDGGHVGIETGSCETHCAPPSSSSDHRESSDHGDAEDHDSCGACIDIPLPSGGATNRLLRRDSKSVSRRVMVCLPHPVEPVDTGPQAAEEYSRSGRQEGGGVSTAPLRTIILLI